MANPMWAEKDSVHGKYSWLRGEAYASLTMAGPVRRARPAHHGFHKMVALVVALRIGICYASILQLHLSSYFVNFA